jgi:hypothetical protein
MRRGSGRCSGNVRVAEGTAVRNGSGTARVAERDMFTVLWGLCDGGREEGEGWEGAFEEMALG